MNLKYNIIIKFLFLELLIFVLGTLLYAREDSWVDSMTILGERDLGQVVNHEPVFDWGSTEKVATLELFRVHDGEESLIWSERPDNFFGRQYKLVTPHLLTDGERYKFFVTDARGDKKKIDFRMNSVPTSLLVENLQNQVFTQDSLFFQFKESKDREIPTDSLQFQIRISDHQKMTEVLIDTLVKAFAPGKLLISETGLPENGKYLLHIKIFDGAEYSDWSEGFIFFMNRNPDPPGIFGLLNAERPQIFTEKPKLRWEESFDPEALMGGKILSYQVEISPYADFLMVSEKFTGNQMEYQPEKIENHRKYYWRVIAMDSDSLLQYSRNIGVFYVDKGNENPPKAQIVKPSKGEILKPSDRLLWKQPKDKNRWDLLTYKIIISEDQQVLTLFHLTQSIIDSIKSGLVRDISISYDNIVQVPLSYLINPALFSEGKKYTVRIETFDNWQGKNVSKEEFFIYDDNINNPPAPPLNGFNPDSVLIRTAQPLFHWEKARDPDINDQLKYEVIISLDPGFFTTRKIQQETKYNENTLQLVTELMENNQYFWKVRSIDLLDTKSDWSVLNTFWINAINEPPVGPVILLHPENYTEFNSESVFWWIKTLDPDPGDRIKYRLEIATDKQFKNKVYSYLIPVVHDNLKWPADPKPGNAVGIFINEHSEVYKLIDNRMYFWRVIAQDGDSLKSALQHDYPRIAYNEKNDPPDIPGEFSPAQGALVATKRPIIRWQHSVDPDFGDLTTTLYYQIKWSKEGLFPTENTQTSQSEIGKNEIQLPEDLTENAKYYYQINAFDRHGGSSGWSGTDSFFVNAKNEAPSVVYDVLPRDSVQIKSDSPILSWKPSTDPDPDFSPEQIHYQIKYIEDTWLGTSKEKEKTKFITTKKGDHSVRLSDLSENHYYYFWVQAMDQHGSAASWSKRAAFSVNIKNDPPVAFRLLYPLNFADSIVTDLQFAWESSFDPDPGDIITYQLYYGEDSTFISNFERIMLFAVPGDTVDHQPTVSLKRATKYFWKVSAEDSHGKIIWGSNADAIPYTFTTVGYRRSQSLGPERYVLYDNKPNPFYSKTTIEYDVKEHGMVRIEIFNVLGEKVKTLVAQSHNSGTYSLDWDGTDDSGSQVPGGMYLCRMTARNFSKNNKMLLLR
ncbi:MAG: hypothetical protein JXQ65_16740 [Candidatus Marinimicrobia bacterium]|nr:hypothetical protein [Candidatus Neomarinimicrobiota bacterium]